MPAIDHAKLQKIKNALVNHHASVVTHFHNKHADTFKVLKKNSLSLLGAAVLAATSLGAAHYHSVEMNHLLLTA